MKKAVLFIGLVAAATVASNVSADFIPGETVVMSRTDTNFGRAIRTNYDQSRSWNDLVTDEGTVSYAAARYFNVQGGGTVATFCAELVGNFPGSRATYEVTDLGGVPSSDPPGSLGAAKQTLLKDLYGRWYESATNWDIPTETLRDYGTAFQMVIWEITYENLDADVSVALTQLDVSRGAMAVTDPSSVKVLNIANNIILSLGTGGFFDTGDLLGLATPIYQDLLYYSPLTVVPGPAVAGLAGLGLIGLRRRRR